MSHVPYPLAHLNRLVPCDALLTSPTPLLSLGMEVELIKIMFFDLKQSFFSLDSGEGGLKVSNTIIVTIKFFFFLFIFFNKKNLIRLIEKKGGLFFVRCLCSEKLS